MAIEFKMPRLGESVVEGTIGKWLKQVGDPIQEFEPLLEVTTDKVDTEVPSPITGVLLEIRAQEGETVDVGEVIAVLGQPDEESASGEPTSPPAVVSEGEPAPSPDAPEPEAAKERRKPGKRPVGRSYLTPVVARIAAEHDVDLSQIQGSGRHGRITKKDILHYLEDREAVGPVPEPQPPSPATEPAAKAPATTPVIPGLEAGDVEVPLSKMRQAIVRHMRQSKDTAAHVTTFFEVDLSRVAAFRAAHKAGFAAEGIRLTYTPFFVEAIVAGLKAYPMLNAVLDGDKMVYRRAINIGIAVDLGEEGLIVPVIRNADEKNLRGLARAVVDLAERGRAHTLSPDDVQGGTFSLTNHGVLGSLAGTPIIPMPQVGIMGVGAIQKRPVVIELEEGDAIAIRPMAYLSLSFDHRAIDGATADRFMSTVVSYLETYGCEE
ncbi:MAG: dihydrolipoamide acetyltransferase family protein [Anaerolineae bacterium]|jgi:2-oxoglutarate dehydrogenase E2 component (dihydrolipoamide succinyltransferase)